MYRPNLLQRAFNNPLFTTVFYGAIWGGVMGAGQYRTENRISVVVNILIALSFGALLTLSVQRQMRRYDKAVGVTSFEQRIALQHTLKSAAVPADPELRSLLPTFLDAYEARLDKQSRGNRLVIPFIVVVYIGNALLWHSWWWVFIGILLIALMFWNFRSQRHIRANIPRLRTKLKG